MPYAMTHVMSRLRTVFGRISRGKVRCLRTSVSRQRRQGLEPAGFSWDVYAPQPPHTQTFRKATECL